VKHWRMCPGVRDGQPVGADAIVPIHFD
jgi:hypothetical protein